MSNVIVKNILEDLKLHRKKKQKKSIHRLRLGLLGYLIPFAPLAFVSQCQNISSKNAFAFSVLFNINTFNRYSEDSFYLYIILKKNSIII